MWDLDQKMKATEELVHPAVNGFVLFAPWNAVQMLKGMAFLQGPWFNRIPRMPQIRQRCSSRKVPEGSQLPDAGSTKMAAQKAEAKPRWTQ